MRSGLLLLAVLLAACDVQEVETACPDPLDTELSEGQAALTRESSFDIDFDCAPVVLGAALVVGGSVTIETALDTLWLSFGADGVLSGAEYGRGEPAWFLRDILSGSMGRDDGRGQFEVVASNGSLFPVRDTLRGHFYAHRADGAEPAAVGRPGASAFLARPGVGAYFRSSSRRAVSPGG